MKHPCVALELVARLEQAQASHLRTDIPSILSKEVEHAQKHFDPRVNEQLVTEICKNYLHAQETFLRERNNPQRQKSVMLMAPTSRVVDYAVGAKAVRILIEELENEGKREELLLAINNGGPHRGVWERVETPVEAIAALLRWSVLNGRAKSRITASGQVRQWIFNVLKKALGSENALSPRLGGISAANSVQGIALGDTVSMMALGSLPQEVASKLPKELRIIGDNEAWQTVDDLPQETQFAGHFAILADGRSGGLLPKHWDSLVVNNAVVPAANIHGCDVIITGSSCVRDFGSLTPERLRILGQKHDVVILTGVQYLSNVEGAKKFFDNVTTLHQAGARVALSYVEAKDRAFECALLAAVRASQSITALSANAGETYQLLLRLSEKGPLTDPLVLTGREREVLARLASCGGSACPTWHVGHENPSWITEAALIVQEILKIPVVRIRGRSSDITVVSAEVSLDNHDEIVQDLIMSRVAAIFKVAMPKGLISSIDDLAPLRNVPAAAALGGLFEVVDFVTDSGFATGHESQIPAKLYTPLHDRRCCFVIPPIDMYVRDGGTTSAGDLMDYIFFSQQAKKLMVAARKSLLNRR